MSPSLRDIANGITLDQTFDDSTLTVRANRALLESLVNNLLVNAVRHNRPGGEISIIVGSGDSSLPTLLTNRHWMPDKYSTASIIHPGSPMEMGWGLPS